MSELRRQLAKEIFEPLTSNEALELARIVTDNTNPEKMRQEAKDRLVCGNARWVFLIMSRKVGSKLGVNDQETALFNSVIEDVVREISGLANGAITSNAKFSTVISNLVESRLKDKIRRHMAQKRREPSRVGIEYAETWAADTELKNIDLADLVKVALERLDENEYVVVTSILGLGEFEMVSQGQLAKAMGLPAHRIQYLFSKAKKKLRAAIESSTDP